MSYFAHEKALVSDKAIIGKDTRVWAFCNVQDSAIIGEQCNICDGCFVEKGAVIGNQVTIKNNVAIFDGVTLGDKVFVGANVSFINDRYPRSRKEDWILEKVNVKKGATIGAGATILCGLTIGEYAFIGAGSVVTKDVPDHALVLGNPAIQKGWVDMCGNRIELSGKAPDGFEYIIENDSLKRVS